jgi:Zn-dependent alcohol dehydrogenase
MFAFSSSSTPTRPPVPEALRQKIAPVVMASSRVLPVTEGLVPLIPSGDLRRGSTIVVAGHAGTGATSLAISLLAGASEAGHWCAAVGLADPGVAAMAELGLDLRRAVFIPRPRAGWAEATADLLDGAELVVLRPPARPNAAAARRLVARARDRRAVLVVVVEEAQRWPVVPEMTLTVASATWQGIGLGHGRLQARRAEVVVSGRHGAVERRTTIWLPSATGVVAPAGTVR